MDTKNSLDAPRPGLDIRVLGSIDAIDADDWNHLATAGNPFLRHEFLAALEHSGCVGTDHGWLPRHLAIYEDDTLLAATPLYVKDNSYGEFVFDWAWADAYERHGVDYYPKLVSAIPYTPATGPRLLTRDPARSQSLRKLLIDETIRLGERLGVSSVHWLFPTEEEKALLQQQDLLLRLGCQYHWHNRGYRDFDDFLGALSAKKRKNIRQERRRVAEAGVTVEIVTGDQAQARHRRMANHYYRVIYDDKFGYPTLNQAFFDEVCARLGDRLLLFFARQHGDYIAAAICFQGDQTLYGRHWGCDRKVHGLHFELCYYQGIDYCITHGLQHFEPGAQGEHKLSRGFVPTPTWSAHQVHHPEFRHAISRYLAHETDEMKDYIDALTRHTPYRRTDTCNTQEDHEKR